MLAPKSEKRHGGHRNEKQKKKKNEKREKEKKKEIKKGATLLFFITHLCLCYNTISSIVITCAHVIAPYHLCS